MRAVLLVAFTSGGSVLLAQGPVFDTGLGQLIGNLGVMGILVWHMWYHTTKTYPTMLEKFSQEISAIRQSFANEQAATRAAHLAEQAATRAAFLKEQVDTRASNSQETAELRGLVFQISGAMRNAVHDVKDTAQTAISQSAISRAAPPVRWEMRKESPAPASEEPGQ